MSKLDFDPFARIEKLETHIAALEAALLEIIVECTWRGVPIKTPQSTEDIFMIARAALDKDRNGDLEDEGK